MCHPDHRGPKAGPVPSRRRIGALKARQSGTGGGRCEFRGRPWLRSFSRSLDPGVFCFGHEPRLAAELGAGRRHLHPERADGPGARPPALAGVSAVVAVRLACRRAAVRRELSRDQAQLHRAAGLSRAQGRDADHLRYRARGARSRHGRLGRRAVLRHARLGQASPRRADHAHRRRARLSRRADHRTLQASSTTGASATSCTTSPTTFGSSSATTAFSACSFPRSMAASAFPLRRSRSFSARSRRAAPTASPSSWCRTRSAPAS